MSEPSMHVTAEMMRALRSVLERRCPSATVRTLWRRLGERLAVRMEERLTTAYPGTTGIRDLSFRDFVNIADSLSGEWGVGRFEAIRSSRGTVVNLYAVSPVFIESAEDGGYAVLVEMLAGMFSPYLGDRVECVELRGDDQNSCSRFLLVSRPNGDRVPEPISGRRLEAVSSGDVSMRFGAEDFSPVVVADKVAVRFGEDVLSELPAVLESMPVEERRPTCYEIGLEWGGGFLDDLERTLSGPIQAFPISRFVFECDRRLTALGWGGFSLHESTDGILVRRKAPAWELTAEHLQTLFPPLWAGFFAGLFSRASRIELVCSELPLSHDSSGAVCFLVGVSA